VSQELKLRIRKFAMRVIRMTKAIKSDKIDDILIKQVVRSATSIGANYRSALKGRSTADFISRITIAEEEADETCYWLEIIMEIGTFPKSRLEPLYKESCEITAILTASGRTANQKRKREN
jgi:four helix bundle protein